MVVTMETGASGGGGSLASGLLILNNLRNTDYSNPAICANTSNVDAVNITCSASSKIYGVADDGTMTQLAKGLTINNLDVSNYNRIAWLCTVAANTITIYTA